MAAKAKVRKSSEVRERPSSLPTRDTIARELGMHILSGRCRPGEVLSDDIAASNRLQVPLATYRQALLLLAAKGLVELRAKTAARVSERAAWRLLDPDVLSWIFEFEPDEDQLASLFELRKIVEPEAAALAAQRRTEAHINQMAEALRGMAKHTLATEEGRLADHNFHAALLDASSNPFLVTLTSGIGAAVTSTTIFKQRKAPLRRDSIPDHQRVFDAVRAGDAAAAHKAMAELVDMAFLDTVVATNNDMAERRRAQQSLQQVQSDLARFNRVMLMGEMTASIAHEINQPISGAITNANAALHWLAADPPNVEEVRTSLERIVKDGYRASDVIARVRALARKIPPRKDPLDINEAVGEVLALTKRQLRSNAVKVKVHLSRDLPLIRADRTQVQQVICNLVVNAIEAMSGTSQEQRQLWITTGPESSEVFVEVRDTGMGLEPAESERLFQSFYTTKPGGMGMGLSLSRSIVEAHGGRLYAAPNEPSGAIFRFTLPVEPSSVDQMA
jgi:C4-dicarboxylate-specific signal transduction histidine kinase